MSNPITTDLVIKIMTDLNSGFQPVIDQLKDFPDTSEEVFD